MYIYMMNVLFIGHKLQSHDISNILDKSEVTDYQQENYYRKATKNSKRSASAIDNSCDSQ